jgi:hypothetical protein
MVASCAATSRGWNQRAKENINQPESTILKKEKRKIRKATDMTRKYQGVVFQTRCSMYITPPATIKPAGVIQHICSILTRWWHPHHQKHEKAFNHGSFVVAEPRTPDQWSLPSTSQLCHQLVVFGRDGSMNRGPWNDWVKGPMSQTEWARSLDLRIAPSVPILCNPFPRHLASSYRQQSFALCQLSSATVSLA